MTTQIHIPCGQRWSKGLHTITFPFRMDESSCEKRRYHAQSIWSSYDSPNMSAIYADGMSGIPNNPS
ncbi:MAG: hypothetical protein ACOX8Q_05490 [Christensenellales bacterium]